MDDVSCAFIGLRDSIRFNDGIGTIFYVLNKPVSATSNKFVL